MSCSKMTSQIFLPNYWIERFSNLEYLNLSIEANIDLLSNMNKKVSSKLLPIDSDLITRGIYIDFEQRIKEDLPQIAGVLIDDEYTCYVVDPRLENAVKN